MTNKPSLMSAASEPQSVMSDAIRVDDHEIPGCGPVTIT
jgi:hypothetical protein